MVARAGFEPAISGLKGRRPSPLDERAVYSLVWVGEGGGRRRFRTADLHDVNVALSQLS